MTGRKQGQSGLWLVAMAAASPVAAAGAAETVTTPAARPAAADRAAHPLDLMVDPRLDTAITLASASHPTIAASRAAAKAAGADLRSARWQRFPSVSVQAGAYNQRLGRLQPEVTIDQPLWTAGRVEGVIDRAGHNQRAAIAFYDQTVLDIALGVAQNYWDVCRLAAQIATLTESQAQHLRMVETMERRVRADVSPNADLELARSRAAQISQQLSTTQAQRLAALQRLRNLVGDPGYEVAGPVGDLSAWPRLSLDPIVTEATRFSPQRARLYEQAMMAKADARIARASLFPQLYGEYSHTDFYGHRAGFVVKAQVDGGFSRLADADAARLRQRSSELEIAGVERDIRDQVVADLSDYDSARERLPISRAASVSSRNVYESYLRQFVAGRRSWLDVMNAIREATTAELDATATRFSGLAAIARLQIRSGRWPLAVDGPAR